MGSSRRFETTSMSLARHSHGVHALRPSVGHRGPGERLAHLRGPPGLSHLRLSDRGGLLHTGSLRRYVGRLLLCALLSEVPFDLVMGGTVFYPFHQNVLWTFLIALLLIRLNERARATGRLWVRLLTGAGTLALGYVLGLLSMADYHFAGVFTVLAFYFFRGRGMAGTLPARRWPWRGSSWTF